MFPTPKKCPKCGQIPPTYLVTAITHKPQISCMNICCDNFVQFVGDTLGEAIGKWDAYCINEERKSTR